MLSASRHEPSSARILYRQFLFRIVELESLSSKADVVKLLGQFASVLVMVSLVQMLGGLTFMDVKMTPTVRQVADWSIEYQLLSLTLLVVGLFTTLSWDALLPDQRDVLVLGPLPVKSLTLWFAKVTASSSGVGLSVLALNFASGLIWPAALAQAGFISILRSYGAYWLTLLFVALFMFSSVLAFQSATALLLSRSVFLRLSAVLQILLFAAILASFFFQPAALTSEHLAMKSYTVYASWFPPNCFTALFFQMRGDPPPGVALVADHGWALLAGSIMGAAGFGAALYPRLLSRIAAAPEIVQARLRLPYLLNLGSPVQTAMFHFVGRSLFRSRQQRLIAAFYLGVGAAILSAVLGMAPTKANTLLASSPTISLKFLVSTIVAMTVAVVGVRAGFAFPVSLRANWIFRLHQIRMSSVYLTATRRALVLFTVIPVCIISAICGLIFEPAGASLEHIALLALYGTLLAGICLYGNLKLPYTCSYLPGTAQIPFLFWGSVIIFIPMADAWAHVEQQFLYSGSAYGSVLVLCTLSVCLIEWRNRALSTNVDIRFDEVPPEFISLGLSGT
jgi:hypothetical protein